MRLPSAAFAKFVSPAPSRMPCKVRLNSQEIGGIHIGRYSRRIAFQYLSLSIGRNLDDPENLAFEECFLRHVEGWRAYGDRMASSASSVWMRRRLNAERSSSTTAIEILRRSCPR